MAFCPRCAAPNLDGAAACATCGASFAAGEPPPLPVGAPPPYAPPVTKTNGLAIAGFVVGLCSILCSITAFVGLPLSIVGLLQCQRSNGQLKGKGLAIAGIVLSSVGVILFVVGLVVNLAMRR